MAATTRHTLSDLIGTRAHNGRPGSGYLASREGVTRWRVQPPGSKPIQVDLCSIDAAPWLALLSKIQARAGSEAKLERTTLEEIERRKRQAPR